MLSTILVLLFFLAGCWHLYLVYQYLADPWLSYAKKGGLWFNIPALVFDWGMLVFIAVGIF